MGVSNEVWVKIGELGFRRHSANVYLIIRRYKRKSGFGVYEKTRGYNGKIVLERSITASRRQEKKEKKYGCF